MKIEEVIEEIISEHKWYIGKIGQSASSRFVKKFRAGKASLKYMNYLAELYGYEISEPAKYKKV